MLHRWLKFNSVGAMGVIVQLVVLGSLTGLADMHYLVATALAVEAAVLHNFTWHEHWTWGDRRRSGWGCLVGRLVRFHLTNGALSLFGNLVFMRLLVEGLGLHYLAANITTIGICSVLNFLVSDRFVFGIPSADPTSPPMPCERH